VPFEAVAAIVQDVGDGFAGKVLKYGAQWRTGWKLLGPLP